MAYAITMAFEGVDEGQYWSVNEKMGISRDGKGGYPPGLILHAGGPTPTGWMVSEVWDSRESQAAFMDARLGAALQAVNIPLPLHVIDTDTVNFQQL